MSANATNETETLGNDLAGLTIMGWFSPKEVPEEQEPAPAEFMRQARSALRMILLTAVPLAILAALLLILECP